MRPDPTVLVVGSHGNAANPLADLIRANRINVRIVDWGLDAWAWIRASDAPVLIILKFDLPDLDCLEVMRWLNGDERSRVLPVLVVAETEDQRREAYRLGATDVLLTPLQDDEAMARVRVCLELGELRQAVRKSSLQRRTNLLPPTPPGNGEWMALATQTGRMYGFEWDTRTDQVRRSASCAQVLAAPDAIHDTGENWFHRVHPEDVDRLRSVLSILSPVYDAYDTKYRVRRSDGQWITIHESSRGFFDANSRLIRVTGIVVDVSDQVRAEHDLATMEQDLLRLMEKLPVAVAITDQHGAIEYINESFQRIFGYTLTDISSPEDWWRKAYPDEEYRHEVIEAWAHAVRGSEADGHHIPCSEYRITGNDGVARTVDVFGAVMGHRKLVLFNDITERRRAEAELRESEERFRLMADTAPIMLWMSGVDKQYTFFNKGWLDFTGRTIEQELGDGWAEDVHPDDRELSWKIYSEAFDAHRTFQMEYRLRRADGEYGCVLDTGVPRFDSNGAFAGYIGSCLDLTEFKRQHEHMLAMQKLESLGVIASGIAHDFNNLLSCILVDANHTVSELEPGSPARNGLQRIEAVAARASEIVRQIMAYARYGPQEMEAVDLCALINEMLRLLQVCLPQNVGIHLQLPDDLPPIRANSAQMRQIVMNLVLNAAEAVGERGGNILVSASRRQLKDAAVQAGRPNLADGEYVCLEIMDNGQGMTEEVQRRIFDPFFTTKLEGRGLGLSAVQRIVDGHLGTISVSSTPGVGTAFEILLPRDQTSALPQPAGTENPSELTTPGSAAVLIVEDEETLRMSVSHMLRKRGFTVLEAADGNRAIELIRSEGSEVDVLLLDLSLPGKSSLDVLEELQRARPDAKVILTSAFGWENVDGRLRTLRYDTFIRKPYRISELTSLVRNAILPLTTRLKRRRQSARA
jgi:PAS domain S-box-containing protein